MAHAVDAVQCRSRSPGLAPDDHRLARDPRDLDLDLDLDALTPRAAIDRLVAQRDRL